MEKKVIIHYLYCQLNFREKILILILKNYTYKIYKTGFENGYSFNVFKE